MTRKAAKRQRWKMLERFISRTHGEGGRKPMIIFRTPLYPKMIGYKVEPADTWRRWFAIYRWRLKKFEQRELDFPFPPKF